MDTCAKIYIGNGSWTFDDYKVIKVIARNERIAFQRIGKYVRGLSISKNAFLKMDDVTIVPGTRMELEPNVWLINYGKSINLVKYCVSKDGKQCDGGFFTFTPKEWNHFWTIIRIYVIDYFDK